MRYCEEELLEELDPDDGHFILEQATDLALEYHEMLKNGEISIDEFEDLYANIRDVEIAVEHSCDL